MGSNPKLASFFYRVAIFMNSFAIDEKRKERICSPFRKKVEKNLNPRWELNPGPRPQYKSDDLDRSAIGPAIKSIV